tara:strand:- start:775 stop:1062 length:288 start_codon:yes stop_codon:yes gene_type:complete
MDLEKDNQSIEKDKTDINSLLDDIYYINIELQYIAEKKTQLEEKKKLIESIMYRTCDHDFTYDINHSYDDICKYICKKCGCYENEFMYTLSDVDN